MLSLPPSRGRLGLLALQRQTPRPWGRGLGDSGLGTQPWAPAGGKPANQGLCPKAWRPGRAQKPKEPRSGALVVFRP